jgi:transcriptional regulator with XRE-family HTH domain
VRRLAELAQISNPYLSQLERGLSEPSVRVLNSLAQALNLSADALLDQAGLLRNLRPGDADARSESSAGAELTTETAIRADNRLTSAQKQALLSVYASYVSGPSNEHD